MPKIFRILNLSPDSFSDGDSALADPLLALAKAQALIDSGAEYIDIGAESTRPGASLVSLELEKQRLRDFLESYDLPVALSLDSRNPEIIAWALELNPRLKCINDVSGLQNPSLLRVLAECCGDEIKFVAMHSRGGVPPGLKASEIPDNFYDEFAGLEEDLKRFFDKTLSLAESYHLDTKNIILDPGLGFGKNLKHSFELIEIIPRLRSEFGLEILLGPSRKSFLKLWKANPHASLPELDAYTREFCDLLGDRVDYLRLH